MKVKRRGQAQWKMVFLLAAASLTIWGCNKQDDYAVVAKDIADRFPLEAKPAGENPQLVDSDGPYAVLHTTAGDITILLYPEQAPKAVENFITLAKEGYYDGSLFYYAKKDELTQTGVPKGANEAMEEALAKASASDAEFEMPEIVERSIWDAPFEDEFDDGLHHFPGAVGMAHDGENQNLSQFYLLVLDEVPEDERVIPANFYMNELTRMRLGELNERALEGPLTQEEVTQFQDDLNEEIQKIATDGVPEEYMKRYEPAIEQYKKVGGAYSLDYDHTVFGQIVDGLNIAQAITQVQVSAADRKPKKDVVIESIEIRE